MPAETFEGRSRMLPPLPPVSPVSPVPPTAFVEDAGRCANCLTPLTGPFCAQCGQHIADYHRSVWRFVVDFFDSAFCWDNKLLRTLDPLIKRPGWLTQEFMAGRRVRYVHPLRLFLFTSLVCLTLIQFNANYGKARGQVGKKAAAASVPSSDEDRDAKPSASAAPSPVASVAASPAASPSPSNDTLQDMLRETISANVKDQKGKDPAAAERLARRWEAYGEKMEKNAGETKTLKQKVTDDLQQRASWVALAMLPIFAWLMRFTYGKRGGYFFAHLVFSLHYHTFLLLFWTAYLWLGTLVKFTFLGLLEPVLLAGLLVPPGYLYLSLKRFYGESRTRTASKTVAIGGLHLLAIFTGLAIVGATAIL